MMPPNQDPNPQPNVVLTDDQFRSLLAALNALLQGQEDIFKLGGAPTTFATHEIKTDHKPISTPPYPVHGPRKEFLNQELDRLLAEGIIEECESPWASPVVLVPKKDGKYRLCVDYRNLNAVTQADTYPMPRIKDLLHSAKSTRYMTTIDLQSEYWQVPVQDNDKDKTCFTTQFGTFRFVRMPFGLRNVPATFMRLMDRFCAGLRDLAIFAYLDDILVLSDTFEDHIKDLTELVNKLISAPVLQEDTSKSCMLRTDASSFALGAVFLQGEENQERPVEYASRLLTSTERNYSTVERDKLRRTCKMYKPKDLIMLKTHVLSSATKGTSAKLMPKRDGPYEICKSVSPTTYILSDPYTKARIGKFHVADLTPSLGEPKRFPYLRCLRENAGGYGRFCLPSEVAKWKPEGESVTKFFKVCSVGGATLCLYSYSLSFNKKVITVVCVYLVKTFKTHVK